MLFLFEYMRRPAQNPAHGEGQGEQLARQTDRFERQSGVKLHVGIQAPVRIACRQLRQDGGFHRLGQGNAVGPAAQISHHAFQDIGPGVAGAVDPVAETHQAFAGGELPLQPGLHAV